MARKSPEKPPETAVDVALARIMGLIARGMSAERAAREQAAILIEWRDTMEPVELKDSIYELLEKLGLGAEYAQEQLDDVDTGEAAAVRQAERTVAILEISRAIAQEAVSRTD